MTPGSREPTVEIVGPFDRREVVIDGWRVPLLTAHELDGGMFNLVIDDRLGVMVDAQHFDRVARFVADTIATCWGYGAHPRDEPDDRRAFFARVPHPSLAPTRVMEITSTGADGA